MQLAAVIAALVVGLAGVQPAVAASIPARHASGHTLLVGIWVKPRQAGPATVAQVESAIGRRFDYAMHYHRLTDPTFPNADELEDKRVGRTPVVSVGCGNVSDVAAGGQDAALDSLASSIAAFGKPVELRYCWEMNDAYRGIDASDFIPAWRHVHDLFVRRGVKNVRFYFCPGAERGRAARGFAYYPGDRYVDDIGVDTYDRRGEGFGPMIDEAYHVYEGIAKPFIIGETGALGTQDQPTFLTASTVRLIRTTYPKISAVMYFDAGGPHGDWSLTPQGLTAFAGFAKAAAQP
jgi:hypothetical protein